MNWKKMLQNIDWKEGGVLSFPSVSYRHSVSVTMSRHCRQQAEFKNDSGQFGAHVQLIRPDGSYILEGNSIVPVLPNGKLLMVVEQRPAHYLFAVNSECPRPPIIETSDSTNPRIDLMQFGRYSCLEFPGGDIIHGEEGTHLSFLRELVEETGVIGQDATLYMRNHPVYPFGSDLALKLYLSVAYLKRSRFEGFTVNDGGLHVLALAPEDVERNIRRGNINSAQGALLGWNFFKEIDLQIRNDSLDFLLKENYVIKKEVVINSE